MSWASQEEVLSYHRMLTKREAALRQGLLALSVGLSTAILTFIYRPLAVGFFFVFAAFLFTYLLILIFPPSLFPKRLSKEKNPITPRPGSSRAKEGEGGSGQKSEEPPESKGEKTDRHFFRDEPTAIERSKIIKFFCSYELVIAVEIVLGLMAAYVALKMLSDPEWAAAPEIAIINTLAEFLAFGVFLRWLDGLELDEFPTAFRDKAALRFLKTFSYSRNYFFLGEVRGKKIGLPRMLRFLHTMIGAPTGEGKSSSLIIPPLLFDADSIGSAVVPDAKSPELFNWVAGKWMHHGKRVYLFDPWHPDTVGINPLPDADDNDLLTITEVIMREREEILKEDAFFKSRTKYLMFAILKLVQSFNEEYCNMASVYHIVQSVDTLESFVEAAPDVIKKLFSDFDDLYSETKVNALTSIREKCDVFMEESVRKAFSKSEFKLNMLFREKEPCLLILGCPIDKKEPGTKIASLLVNLIINLAFRERRMQKQRIQLGEQASTPNDVYLYLDELRNLKITALADLVSIARETRTHVIDSVTDLGFFKYYKEDYSSLLGNHRCRIFMRGLDYDSAKYVSDSLGKDDFATYKYFRGLMASQEQRNLLDPDKVMNLPEDKLIIFSPKTRPFVADKVSIYKTRWLMKMRMPAPQKMRELYREWEIATEPLVDTRFPKIEGTDLFDFSKIKGNKTVEQMSTSMTAHKFEQRHREVIGGGTYKPEDRKDEDERQELEAELKRARENDDVAGLVATDM